MVTVDIVQVLFRIGPKVICLTGVHAEGGEWAATGDEVVRRES